MAHAIGTELFSYWEGDPPALPIQHVARFTRPGINGVGLQLAGRWGEPFEAICTAHYPSYPLAIARELNYNMLVGDGPRIVIYNQLDYAILFGVVYTVESYQTVEIQAGEFLGPGFYFPNGGKITGRFILTPHPLT